MPKFKTATQTAIAEAPSETSVLPARCHLKSKSGISRIFSAARYSFLGMKAAWKHEAAFRQEVFVGILLLIAVPWLAPSLTFGVLMCASIVLVWCVEMVNSAIEALADAISVDMRPLLGRAKDLGSAAVFFSLLIAGGVWITALIVRLKS